MTDANAGAGTGAGGTTGSAPGAGASGNAGAGTGGAGASGSTGTSSGGTPAAADWTTGLAELDRGYIQNKGWKGPGDVLSSYQNMEKLHGVPENQILKLPAKDDDKDGWGKVYDRLGRPAKPEEYGMKGPDGKDMTDFQKWASSKFFEAGLSRKQAEALATAWDAQVKTVNESQKAAFDQKIEAETNSLKKDWGLAYDQSIKEAQKAFNEFGVTPEHVDAMEQAMGYAATMKFFQKVGSKLSEASFVSGDKGQSFGALSPEAAKSKIDGLKSDQDFLRRFGQGDTAARDELTRLTKFAYPEHNG